MTVLVPPHRFDGVHGLRGGGRPVFERDRVASVVITIAIHLLIVVAALTAVRVARPQMLPELSVQIMPDRPKPAAEIKPPQHLIRPAAIAVPPPDIVVQAVAPPPVAATVPPAASVAAPAQAGTQKPAGESRDSFLGQLLAQLNRFKQYPRAARQAHIEGVVMLHFVMDADGKVQSFEIAKSSGRPVLDNEALALISRAQPLPPLPADFPTRTLDAVVPIEFSLNG